MEAKSILLPKFGQFYFFESHDVDVKQFEVHFYTYRNDHFQLQYLQLEIKRLKSNLGN